MIDYHYIHVISVIYKLAHLSILIITHVKFRPSKDFKSRQSLCVPYRLKKSEGA
jgi:hypothetical protein